MPEPTEVGTCAVCHGPFNSTRNALAVRNRRVPAKQYCSTKCSRRAYYLRRKERDASAAITIENPTPIQLDGWPLETKS